jgi:hypothetical protein
MNYKSKNVSKEHYIRINSFHNKFTPELKSIVKKAMSQKQKKTAVL